MTVLDTTKLSSDDIVRLIKGECIQDGTKQDLPTIIDVVEYLALLENENLLTNVNREGILARTFDEGKYIVVSEKIGTNVPKLFPTSLSTFTFMRGQNNYYPQCNPILYRKQLSSDEVLIKRIQTAEFFCLLTTHPVFKELQQNYEVEYLAIAQHYGFDTEYLDITNNKWVAAFFASCKYDQETSTYTPIDETYGNGIGVLYVSNENIPMPFFDKMHVVGFQFFQRPTKQYSMVYHMDSNENFDQNPNFKRIVFRHDAVASKQVYDVSYRQQRFFPNDILAQKANIIRNSHYEFSKFAFKVCREFGWTILSDEEIKDRLNMHGYKYHDNDDLLVRFSEEELKHDWEEWINYGREHLKSLILPMIPICKLDDYIKQ